MKLFLAMTATLLLMVGCAGNKEQPAANATSTNQAGAEKSKQPSTTEAKTDSTRPIEFTCLGVSADKKNVNFNIKVNADKRITQVDVALKEMDDSGKVLLQTDYAWQNIVKSVRQPIEKGKSYLGEGYLYPGATRVECSLKRVIFEDGTRWSPS